MKGEWRLGDETAGGDLTGRGRETSARKEHRTEGRIESWGETVSGDAVGCGRENGRLGLGALPRAVTSAPTIFV